MSEFIIKEFPNDGNYWRVDGIGKVALNPYVDSEPKVQVLLSGLTAGYDDPLRNPSRVDDVHSAWIGVGQLPLVSIGSVWLEQSCLSVIGGPDGGGKIDTFEIDTSSKAKFGNEARPWRDTLYINNQIVSCIPRSYYAVGKNYGSLADSLLWVYPVKHPKCSVVLIPTYEILRSYYLSSNKVAKAVFENDIGLLIDTKESTTLEDGSVYLMLLKTADDLDAWFLARWYASEVAKKQIQELNRSIVTASVNATPYSRPRDIGTHISIDFPFEGVTKLRAAGKFMKLNNVHSKKEVWGFLVLNIQSCTHPMPFKDVICDRKNNAAQGLNKEDESLPATAFPAPSIPDQEFPDNPILLASDEEPSKSYRALVQANFKERFLDLAYRELIKDPKVVQHYRSAAKHQLASEEFSQHGTGDGTFGETSTGMINIRQQPMLSRDKLPADLQTFIQVIKQLRILKHNDQWTINTVELMGRSQPVDEIDLITCFPSNIHGCVSWHLMSQFPSVPRALVIAKIESPSGISYLLEMERKKDKHCTLILYSEDRRAIDDRTMDIFLATTAKENAWPPPSKLPKLQRLKVHHNENRTIVGFANKILEKLNTSV